MDIPIKKTSRMTSAKGTFTTIDPAQAVGTKGDTHQTINDLLKCVKCAICGKIPAYPMECTLCHDLTCSGCQTTDENHCVGTGKDHKLDKLSNIKEAMRERLFFRCRFVDEHKCGGNALFGCKALLEHEEGCLLKQKPKQEVWTLKTTDGHPLTKGIKRIIEGDKVEVPKVEEVKITRAKPVVANPKAAKALKPGDPVVIFSATPMPYPPAPKTISNPFSRAGSPIQMVSSRTEDSIDLGDFSANTVSSEIKVPVKPIYPPKWVCSNCNYDNFHNRKECRKCGKDICDNNNTSNEEDGFEVARSKKKPTRKYNNWTCPKCRHLNFEYRTTCNRYVGPGKKCEVARLSVLGYQVTRY
eukprot:TRINITY_DN1718_c0_g1_i1.p1 TRINITY_DN1718_c0_g1~~TRINITY_DN1718_c0_g1_i1.p1  ORF type:complete len:356 (+),score=23.80 TRINITY_DN1718_c0_g1_i1:225-1292(+)